MMGRIPNALRETIAKNIRSCRVKRFPGRGGSKKCAEALGVSPQQWSPWERGMRTPDEGRMIAIAKFFGVTVEWLRTDHSMPPGQEQSQEQPGEPPGEQSNPDQPSAIRSPSNSALNASLPPSLPQGIPFTCPPCCPLLSQWSDSDMRKLTWLLEKFMASQTGNRGPSA